MFSSAFYTLENLNKVKYVQYAVIALALVVCGYVGVNSIQSMASIRSAEANLKKENTEANKLIIQIRDLKKRAVNCTKPGSGGIENFAVTLSNWAKSHNVSIESVVPEGTPSVSEVTVRETKLGNWANAKVRVKGHGNYSAVMSLMDEFTRPRLPVQLETIALQSTDSSGSGNVSFDILLTVYEREKSRS